MDSFIELAGGPPIPLVIVGEGRRVHIAGVNRMTACNRRWSWSADLEVAPTCAQCLAAVAHLLAVSEPDERLDRVVEAVESMAHRLGTASRFDTPGDQADRVRRRKLPPSAGRPGPPSATLLASQATSSCAAQTSAGVSGFARPPSTRSSPRHAPSCWRRSPSGQSSSKRQPSCSLHEPRRRGYVRGVPSASGDRD